MFSQKQIDGMRFHFQGIQKKKSGTENASRRNEFKKINIIKR